MPPSLLPHRRARFNRYHYAILATVVLISGCAAKHHKPLENNILAFETFGQIINKGSPLKITVVQLSSKTRFMAEEYFNLQNDVDKALDDQLLVKDEVFITPNEDKKIIILDPAPGVRYVGLFAEYKQIEDKAWRLLFPMPPAKTSSVWTSLWASPDPGMSWVIPVTPAGFQRPSTLSAQGAHSTGAERQERGS